LLREDMGGFLFANPGGGVQRALLQTPAHAFAPVSQPRMLFAWACPEGAGESFKPDSHVKILADLFDCYSSILF
jgi:hypothetical protein